MTTDYPSPCYPPENPFMARADEVKVGEIALFAQNDEGAYRIERAVVDNLARHFLRGEYDPDLAVKGCFAIADSAAIGYEREFGRNKNARKAGDITWCAPADRKAAAYCILVDLEPSIQTAIDDRRDRGYKPAVKQSAKDVLAQAKERADARNARARESKSVDQKHVDAPER